MLPGSPPRPEWRCVATTPWLTAAAGAVGGRAALRPLGAFLGATWRLPSWVPTSSARHTLSPLLPRSSELARVVRALHGRMVVVNLSPVAQCPRADAALVRGLVGAAIDGLPPSPWPAGPWPDPRARGSATWPRDSRTAYAQVLAHAWLRAHDPDRAFRSTGTAAVALYEGPPSISMFGDGAEHTADVRAEIVRRLPARALDLPRVVATVPYQLVVVAARGDATSGRLLERDVPAVLAAGRALATPGSVAPAAPSPPWFLGTALVPDPVVVAAMDGASRLGWAARTGRAGHRDAYWHPEAWARFLEPGRTLGCVTAATVGRSAPSGRRSDGVLGPGYDRVVERGLCVPPAYALVDCIGTLGVNVVRL
ncbi:MAG TPA: hypothetical protein VGD56_03540 [Gemmatirosa sp.]